jgi:plastocyanin
VVTWTNNGAGHHTVTADQGSSLPTHCINGRGFVGNSPTVVARAGQKIRWYVFNLDLSHNWHNFHPHNQRWRIGHESFDVRSMGPAESFVLDTEAPPVLLLPEDIAEIQDGKRPKDAAKYTLRGDFLFHCHVHHHMRNGMIGVVRSVQEVWLTPEMKQRLEDTVGLPVWDEDADPNPIPDVDPQRCRKLGGGSVIELAVDPEVVFMHACLLPERDEVLYWERPGPTRVACSIPPGRRWPRRPTSPSTRTRRLTRTAPTSGQRRTASWMTPAAPSWSTAASPETAGG